jgi:hypothetical protein
MIVAMMLVVSSLWLATSQNASIAVVGVVCLAIRESWRLYGCSLCR